MRLSFVADGVLSGDPPIPTPHDQSIVVVVSMMGNREIRRFRGFVGTHEIGHNFTHHP